MGIGGRLLLILILKYSFAFSTDEFMSCDRFYQSKRRARILDDIPCDMGSSNYCEIKGSSYPEASIWRFKEENRALMKRMYGDLESTSLYREMRSSKLSPGGPADHAHHPPPADIFSSLQYDIRVGSGFQKESKLIKKVIRKKIRNEARPVVLTRSTTASSTLPVASEQAPSESMTFSVPLNDITTTASSLLSEAPTPSTTTTLGTTPQAQSTIPFDEDITETETQSSSAATFTYDALSTFAPLRTEQFTEEPSDVNFEGLTIPSTTAASSSTVPTKTTTRTTTTTSGSTTMESDLETQEPLFLSTLKYPQKTDVESREDFNPDEILSEDEAIFFESPVEYDYSGPSENACPVKEEVLAPFWANNTRDQVLALLNLYPFEQYIHMETCKLENQQFMCNEGCRCEQQYRLHRLLAFDPTNECRGIFSDWFRFPSYCVCKCYKKKNGPDVGLGLVGGRLRRKPRGSSGNREIPRRKKK